MKKSAIFILLTLTLVFIAFVSGVYVGRNHLQGGISLDITTAPTSTSPTNAGNPGGATQSTSPSATTTEPQVPTSSKPIYPININTATVEELDLLPDIGPSRAKAIIDYRTEYGPFTSVDDLLYVSGIGEKILAKIRPYITV